MEGASAKPEPSWPCPRKQRDAFFNGRKDADGRSIDRGVIGVRGVKAAEEIPATMERLLAARGP